MSDVRKMIIEKEKNKKKSEYFLLFHHFQTMFLYIVAQFIGAFMGYGLIVLITPKDILMTGAGELGLCVVTPHNDVLPWQAFVVEYVASSALIGFCCGIWDPRNAAHQDSTPLKFGLAVTGLAAVAVRQTHFINITDFDDCKLTLFFSFSGTFFWSWLKSCTYFCPCILECCSTVSMGKCTYKVVLPTNGKEKYHLKLKIY